jgi:hypothetical protein
MARRLLLSVNTRKYKKKKKRLKKLGKANVK